MTPLVLIAISSTVIIIATVSTVVTVLLMKPSSSEKSLITPTPSSIVVENGLLAYYKCEGNSIDSMGLYNLTTVNVSSYPGGKIGQGMYLTAFSYASSVQLTTGNEWTVSCWVKFDSFLNDAYNEIWGTGVSINSPSGLLVALYYDLSSNSISFWHDDNPYNIINTPSILKWYHIVVTAGNGNFSFYVDGVFNSTTTSGNLFLNFTGFTLGGYLGSDSWPNIPMDTNLYLNPTIANRLVSYSTTAAAISWNFICSGYETRAAWINAIIASAKGLGGTTKPCYKIQPIKQSIYPDTIKGLFCQLPGTCTDINDDSLAKFDNGTLFSEFLVIPYSGCRGDCGVLTDGSYNHHDCVNGCDGIVNWIHLCTAPSPPVPANCGSVYAMANNNWNASIYLPLLKGNGSESIGLNISISPQTNYGRNPGVTWDNWCTGQNMHFDVVPPVPWATYMIGGNNSNIRVRWRPAACNENGNFDPSSVATNTINSH